MVYKQYIYSRVCTDHFTKNDFKTIVGGRNHILLKKDAAPKIFITKTTTTKKEWSS